MVHGSAKEQKEYERANNILEILLETVSESADT